MNQGIKLVVTPEPLYKDKKESLNASKTTKTKPKQKDSIYANYGMAHPLRYWYCTKVAEEAILLYQGGERGFCQ